MLLQSRVINKEGASVMNEYIILSGWQMQVSFAYIHFFDLQAVHPT